MLTPWNIYCEASGRRGVLRHAWLENQILNKTPEEAITLCSQPQGWRALERDFPSSVRQASELVESLVEGASPAQLIDKLGPFTSLTDESRTALKRAVHEAYLESSGILELKGPITTAIDKLEAALIEFRKAWTNRDRDGLPLVHRTWLRVRECADALRDLLEHPKGVVFP